MRTRISAVNMYYPNPYGNTEQQSNASMPANMDVNPNMVNEEESSWEAYFPIVYDVLFSKSDEEKLAKARTRLSYWQQLLKQFPGRKVFIQPKINEQKEIIAMLEAKAASEGETRTYMSIYKFGGAIAAIGVTSAVVYAIIQFGRYYGRKGGE